MTVDLKKQFGDMYQVADVAGKSCVMLEHGARVLSQGSSLVLIFPLRNKRSAELLQSLGKIGQLIGDYSRSREAWIQLDPKRFNDLIAIIRPLPSNSIAN
jgi:hypothetical protein